MGLLGMLSLLVLLAGCGSSSKDTGSTPEAVANGGKGATTIPDGTYKLTGASVVVGTIPGASVFVLSNNTYQLLISWKSDTGQYAVEVSGQASLTFSGTTTPIGCASGTTKEVLQLNSANDIVNRVVSQECTSVNTTPATSTVLSDSLVPSSSGLTRSTRTSDGAVLTGTFSK